MRVRAQLSHQDVPIDAAVTMLSVEEGLSKLTHVEVEVLLPEPNLDLDAMLWSTAAVVVATVEDSDVPPRAWHGVIEAARYLGPTNIHHRYALSLRPHLHGLAYRVRTRIFQGLDVVAIVNQVLTDAGVPADSVQWDTNETYPPRTYTTQWKESELDFIQRLLEDEGIFYWFEHEELGHVLHFGDSNEALTPIEGDSQLPLRSMIGQAAEAFWHPLLTTRVVHDGYRSRDWNFESPAKPLECNEGGEGLRRRVEYPGGYGDESNGARLAAIRAQEAWHDRLVLRAESNCLRLAPGRRVELVDAKPESIVGEYVLLSVRHTLRVTEREAGGVATGGRYESHLAAIPSDVPYRPPRLTPRPVVSGLETAVVTGPAGEEIHVDEWGRIKVHFYWDRESPVDDTASCWIRFQQLNTQGAMVLPRLGWEVHVAFMDGDPDRPVAIHKAYNQETMPPYAQPANKTQCALQSSTTPGGGSTNELRMQDGNGGMEWSLNASKDLNVVVANDENETIGVDASETVGDTMSCTVGADETGTVGGNQAVSVSVSASTETGGGKSVGVGGNDDWGITGNFGWKTGGDRTETIGGLMNVLANEVSETFMANHTRDVGAVQAIVSATAIAETVGGNKTENVSAAKALITGKEYAETISGAKSLTSGAVTVKTGDDVAYKADGAIALTAAGIISIKCGDDALFSGTQLRVTSGSAKLKGGGGVFKMGGTISVDAKKFGGKSGPLLELKGTIDYK